MAELSGVTTSATLSSKISSKFNWFWVADVSGEVGGDISESKSEEEVRQRILSNPGPKHIVPILKELPLMLVVEDFHYLRPQVRKTIFQQWKLFVDEQVSVILVGTSHHADDLIKANRELSSRKTHINVGMWSTADLKKIPNLGMEYLGVEMDATVPMDIANEAVGLPVIAQQASEQILFDKGYIKITPGKEEIKVGRKEVSTALHHLAREKYSEFEMAYKRIVKGPRENARKYDTYKLVLSTFAEEPIRFSLDRNELEQRLKKVPSRVGGVKIEAPPKGSVNSTLKALNNHQKKIGREVMEWIEEDNTLYIVEPVFLFYLRWRVSRDSMQPLFQMLLTALHNFVENGGER